MNNSKAFKLEKFEGEIIKALEDDRFKWRTVHGIAKQTQLEPQLVMDTLANLSQKGIVIRSSRSEDGAQLFTTRSYYKKVASPLERLAAGFLNRASF
jgi:predicted transcriptional regulator